MVIDSSIMTRGSSQNDESTSRSLLRRAREKNASAWKSLFAIYGPFVYQSCRRAGLQSNDSADVTQNVFLAVSKGLETFRRDQPGDTFRGWLWTITRNKIRDFFRARSKRPNATGGNTAQVLWQQLADAQAQQEPAESEAFHSAIARRAVLMMQTEFEDSTWRAFWMTAIEQCPTQVVADELGISVAAVYMAKSRVLRRLREEFEGLEVID